MAIMAKPLLPGGAPSGEALTGGDVLASGEVLAFGEVLASGEVLALSAPISFWGGVDPATGTIIDARHPERGQNIAGRILALPGTIGSSSASAVLLELVHAGKAPAVLMMDAPDAILLLGLVVAREMGWTTPAAWQVPKADQRKLKGHLITIEADGAITITRKEG